MNRKNIIITIIAIIFIVIVVKVTYCLYTNFEGYPKIEKYLANKKIAQEIEWKTIKIFEGYGEYECYYILDPDTIKDDSSETHLCWKYAYIMGQSQDYRTYDISIVINKNSYQKDTKRKWIKKEKKLIEEKWKKRRWTTWKIIVDVSVLSHERDTTWTKITHSPFNLFIPDDDIFELKPSVYLKKLSSEEKISFNFLEAFRYKFNHKL